MRAGAYHLAARCKPSVSPGRGKRSRPDKSSSNPGARRAQRIMRNSTPPATPPPSLYALPLRLPSTPLVLPQVSDQLPLADFADVLLPLLAFGFDEPLVDMLAQRAADHRVFLQRFQRLVQVPRQLVNAVLAPLPVAHLEDVLVDRIGGSQFPLDAIETRRQLYRERQIWVRRGVGHAQL